MTEPAPPIERLRAIMARLRDPATGCEWDSVQTFASIAPYTIEEAYEVADACERGDLDDLKDELGDLLLQVVFHARMAQEGGAFDFDDVAAAISDKMERRHPHIFPPAHPEEPLSSSKRRLEGPRGGHHLWEEVKAQERAAKGHASALDGVALGLPALTRAEKIQKRAARVGFDWPDASGPRAKIHEELAEAEAAVTQDERAAEIGDLLFAVTNYARHHQVDPEQALRAATARFEQRFRLVEASAGAPLAGMDIEQLEALWQRAKAQLASA